MAVCPRPHGLHTQVLSALQPLRIPQTSSERERRVRYREREGEGERERERVITCTVGFWQADSRVVRWPGGSLFVWLVGCQFGWQGLGLDGGLAGRLPRPGMDDWWTSRLPACIPARRLPCGAEPTSLFAIFSPCAVRCREREKRVQGKQRLSASCLAGCPDQCLASFLSW